MTLFGVEADLGFGVPGSPEKVGLDARLGKRLGEEFGLVKSSFRSSGSGYGDGDDEIVGD